MKIYPDEHVHPGSAVGFEIDNVYVSLATVARILKGVSGVTEVKKRKLFSKWEEVHIRFRYHNHRCVVVEPFGDNSRYWIGPNDPKEKFDISGVAGAFRRYQPPLLVKISGDIITLNFKRLFKGD